MVVWIKNIITRLLRHERCAHTFALSCSVGVYIAFSPFLGFHTALVFVCSWLFSLNGAVVLAVSALINNPWSMVPIYGIGYLCGTSILSVLGCNHVAWNPSWVTHGNAILAPYIGCSGFSFWAFMVGGNLLGILFGLLSYPITKMVATSMLSYEQGVVPTILSSKGMGHALARKAEPVQPVVHRRKQYTRKEHEISDTK